MFIILDTNHYRELASKTTLSSRLEGRLIERECEVFTTIVTIQEIAQGWLAEINRRKAGRDQIHIYRQFHQAVLSFEHFTILEFDEEAASHFHSLQDARLGIGTMDLKIAAIAKSHDALLLSRNLIDFKKVPGLKVENWLD